MELAVTNPATGAVIGRVLCDDAASIAAKYQKARAAQPEWQNLPLRERLSALHRFRQLVEQNAEEAALLLTREVGKPITQSRNELKGVLSRLDFFLAETERTLAHEVVFTDNTMREEIEHEPLGVIANISAWNYPWFVSSNVFIPALLAGNAVLYKPSEYALLTGQLMADWLKKSGVPDAIFGVVFGGGEAGALLVDQPVDGIFFTGSYATGQKIAQRVAGRMLKLQLELGGKDPAYVTDDVDIAFAAESTADGAMYNTGQSCCSVERLYVHEKIYPEFIAHFVETVRNYKIGDPESEDTYIGALTRGKAALDFLLTQIEDAIKRGGKILCGGRPVERGGGFFLEPTVIENADHSMALMREESFGPVIGVMKVHSDEQAIQLMNDTDYGLTAAVYCRDLKRAQRILSQVKTGTAYANCCDRVSPRLPWSGRNKSGVGLTLSRYGIETFTQPKAWHLRQIG